MLKEKILERPVLTLQNLQGNYTVDRGVWDKKNICVLLLKQRDGTDGPIKNWSSL